LVKTSIYRVPNPNPRNAGGGMRVKKKQYQRGRANFQKGRKGGGERHEK